MPASHPIIIFEGGACHREDLRKRTRSLNIKKEGNELEEENIRLLGLVFYILSTPAFLSIHILLAAGSVNSGSGWYS